MADDQERYILHEREGDSRFPQYIEGAFRRIVTLDGRTYYVREDGRRAWLHVRDGQEKRWARMVEVRSPRVIRRLLRGRLPRRAY